jgi:uncharacterized repeat protein (TIGR01451 family)
MPAVSWRRAMSLLVRGLVRCAALGCIIFAARTDAAAIETPVASGGRVSALTGRPNGQASTVGRSAGIGRGSRAGAASPAAASSLELTMQFHETSYYMTDAAFVSSMQGWAVGEPHWDQASKGYVGTIVRTMDGGETWTAQTAPTLESLNGVDFVDANNGWAVGAGGTIVHTNDGGTLWTLQTVATTDEFRGVSFVDASHGWAVCLHPTHYDWMGYEDNWQAAIWSTADGGVTWTQQTLPAGASVLHSLDFVDAQNGWAVGAKYIGDDAYGDPEHRAIVYHTTNGGQTWSEQILSMDLQVTLTAVDFVDASYGWAVGFAHTSSEPDGLTFHTTDGGQTWQRQTPGSFMMGLRDVQFSDRNRGYAVGTGYGSAWGPPVWRTMDGGATWEEPIMEQHDGEGLYGLAVFSDRVVALGDHDYVAISTDPWGVFGWPNGGNLFTQRYVNVHYRFEDVSFATGSEGWAVGSRSYAPGFTGQVILHTSDGGASWVVQYEKSPDLGSLFSYLRLDGVFFLDASQGWAVGVSLNHQSAILHTANGGQTWQEQGSGLYASWDLEFVDVRFVSPQEGWALAVDNFPSPNVFLAHTTNGGVSWQWVDTGVAGPIAVGFALVQGALDFPDALHGWVVGYGGRILTTADGGATWTTQALSGVYPTRDLNAIDMRNSQTGWTVGDSSYGDGIYSTTNGGQLWSLGTIDTSGGSWTIWDIQFTDALHGWLTGSGGRIRYSADGGGTWSPLADDLTGGTLLGLSFVSSRKGWLVGEDGAILQVSNAPSDLSITNTDNHLTVVAGQATAYTITVANAGPGDATGATVTDVFPAAVTSVVWTCTATGGASCSHAAGSGNISESVDVPTGGSVQFVATATVSGSATGTLTTTASVAAPLDGSDPDPTNNTATDTDTITAVPATIVISTRTKSVGAGPYFFGSPVHYTLTLGNSGNFAQPDNPGHELVDPLPSPLMSITASATSGTALVSGHTVTWDGSIAAGGSVTITIDATVGPMASPGATLSNQATVSYDADVDGVNETAVPTDDPSLPGASDPTSIVIASPAMDFYTLSPCRVLDTRTATGTYGGPALAAGAIRLFPLFGRCGIPATALAVSVNLAVMGSTKAGNVRLYPGRAAMPTTSTVNYSAGQTRGNNAVVGLNGLGELAVYCAQASGTAHVVLDVNGYFE